MTRKLKMAIRGDLWKRAVKELDDIEGENHVQRRLRLKPAAKMPLVDQQRMREAMERWFADKEQAHLDPTHVPDMSPAGLILPDDVSQHLSEIMRGVDEYFLCRSKTCGWFGLNTDWITNGSHFRCPNCTLLYRLWVSRPSLIPAQKDYVVQPPEDNTCGG